MPNFPIGVYAVQQKDIELATKIGFEVIHEYRFEESPNKDDEVAIYLDTALKNNLKVFLGFDRNIYNNQRVEQRVNRFKNHKALWAWYIIDEPKIDMEEKVKTIAGLIKSLDPSHPTIIASDEAEFIKVADMNFAYTYPVGDNPYPQNNLSSYVKRTKLSASIGKPFLSLVQAFNWKHYQKNAPNKNSFRLPNFIELRFMAYTGIALGSQGLFFFSFQTLPADIEYLNNVISPLVKEVKEIRNFLAWEKVSIPNVLESDSDLISQCWQKGNAVFMIVTNPAPINVEYNVNLSYLQNFSGSFLTYRKETLEPWGVRIHQFKAMGN